MKLLATQIIMVCVFLSGRLVAQTPPGPTGTPVPTTALSGTSPATNQMPTASTAGQNTSVVTLPTPDPYRGHYIDISAALFGWLSVIFGLITLGISVAAIICSIKGISHFRDLLRQIELDLRGRVERRFQERLTNFVDSEIRPRIQSLIDSELNAVLDGVRLRTQTELNRAVEESDVRVALIEEIVTIIQNRESQTRPIAQDEF